MARRDQLKILTALAFFESLSMVINSEYLSTKNKGELFKLNNKFNELVNIAQRKTHYKIEEKDLKFVKEKIDYMEESGINKCGSCRPHIGMCIALTTDLIIGIPDHSEKKKVFDDIQKCLEEMWEYFAKKNKRDDLDEKGHEFYREYVGQLMEG